jgi:hypothetical protein
MAESIKSFFGNEISFHAGSINANRSRTIRISKIIFGMPFSKTVYSISLSIIMQNQTGEAQGGKRKHENNKCSESGRLPCFHLWLGESNLNSPKGQ